MTKKRDTTVVWIGPDKKQVLTDMASVSTMADLRYIIALLPDKIRNDREVTSAVVEATRRITA